MTRDEEALLSALGYVGGGSLASVGEAAVAPRERRLVDALWLMCVTYPLYTDGIRSRAAAYAGNAVIAGTVVARARKKGRKDAAALVLPVLPWVTVATLTLLTERRHYRDRQAMTYPRRSLGKIA